MGKKQEPIINGIDVSECKYLICDRLHNCECKAECTVYPETVSYDDCKGINCYFKQLKRLQEENEELKAERNQAVNEFNALITDIMIDIPFTGIKNTGTSIKSHLRKMQKALKVLEEIRNVCKMDCGDCQYNQDCDCNFQECEEAKIDDILEKCNEVLI